MSGQLHIPAALPLGKGLLLPIDYEAGTTRGTGLEVLEKRKFFSLPGKEPFFGHPERSLVTISSELSWL